MDTTAKSIIRQRICTLALTCLAAVTVLVLGQAAVFSAELVPPAGSCRPAAPERGSSCSKDSQCCAGLVCQQSACRAGCRIGSTYYASGAGNPANSCQTCQPGVSTTSFTTLVDGATCNDRNGCTQTDTCQSGVCQGSNPVTCTAQDQCHTAGTCNPSTGSCSNPAKSNGSACDDANACTRTDSCQSGVCRGTNPVGCSAPDSCHNAGTCNPATGTCTYPAKPNGTTCSDGNKCTRQDSCQSGVCTGSNPEICQSSEQCHDPGVCDPATGACSSPDKPNGTPCSDGDACTRDDTCQSGTCTGSSWVICLTPGVCQGQGSCDQRTGECVYPTLPDGSSCSDGNACTNPDTCQSGACVPGEPTLCFVSSPAPCQTLAADCNPANGLCYPRLQPDGAACDDGNACTIGDTCHAGVCTGGPCPAGSLCCGDTGTQSCKNIGSDTANCGGCGQACPNGSVCLLGQCYDGCVINGVGYQNGTHNPDNDCQECNTSFSRTAWASRGTLQNPAFCSEGCYTGFCFQGACSVTGQGSGACPGDTCAAGSCTNGHCAYTPINEGATCTPRLSTNPCKSSTTGTCQAGSCVPANANNGGYCRVTSPDPSAPCQSPVDGTCSSGGCVPDTLPTGTTCRLPSNLCRLGTCQPLAGCNLGSNVTCPVPDACGGDDGSCSAQTGECAYPEHPPYPSNGQIPCYRNGGPDPTMCCPGQVCICYPTPAGIPQFCIGYGCWNPADIPGQSPAPGSE